MAEGNNGRVERGSTGRKSGVLLAKVLEIRLLAGNWRNPGECAS